MKSFQIIEAKTMDMLKEELFKLSKKLEETRDNKFIKEIDTFSVLFNSKSDVFQAMVMISHRFNKNYTYTPEEKTEQTSFKEKNNKNRNKSNNKKGEDIVSKFFKDDNIGSEAKERMYQKQKRKGKFNK